MQQYPTKDAVDRSMLIDRLNEVRQFILSHDDDDHDGITRNRDRTKQIITFAITEIGVTYLRNLVRTDMNEEEFGNFVLNVVLAIHVLMTDKCGRRLVLDVLERCNAAQINHVVNFVFCNMFRSLKSICVNVHGCHVIKTLILRYLVTGANITSPQGKDRILEALRPISIELSESLVGCQVIQTCFDLFSPKDTCYIALEIAPHSPILAMDPVGCQSLQKYLETDIARGGFILKYVAAYALMLSQHQSGNYVVQCVLKLGNYAATSAVMAGLENNFATLSMNKFGSNVVEACLREGHRYHVAQIIAELVLYDGYFLHILQDEYGNFVAQTALKRSKEITGRGTLHRFLVDAVLENAGSLQGHVFGSRVLDMATGKKGLRNHGLHGNWGGR